MAEVAALALAAEGAENPREGMLAGQVHVGVVVGQEDDRAGMIEHGRASAVEVGLHDRGVRDLLVVDKVVEGGEFDGRLHLIGEGAGRVGSESVGHADQAFGTSEIAEVRLAEMGLAEVCESGIHSSSPVSRTPDYP